MHDASDLARRLARNAEGVCRHYLPNGRRQGRYWLVGDVEGTPGRSLFVRLVGPEAGKGATGKWTVAATGEHGDAPGAAAMSDDTHAPDAEPVAPPATSQTVPPDPRPFQLRGDPPRVMRLSRKVLAVVGVVAGLGIGGSLIYALLPAEERASEELYNTESRSQSEAVTSGPRDYADVPQLGPPLTANVYDSPTGRILLVPQGARPIGEYDSEIAAGQTRVLLAWNRLIMPGGLSIILERQLAADAAGFAGLQDRVDQRRGNLLRAAAVSTLLGVGAELGADGEDDLVRALRRGPQSTINQAGQRIVDRQLNVQPTLTIRPGHPLRVILTRDLILEPVGGNR